MTSSKRNQDPKSVKGGRLFYGNIIEEFRKAAETGDPRAQFCLGTCYKTGDGVEIDETEAAKWLRKAAEQGIQSTECEMLDFRPVLNPDEGELAARFERYMSAAEKNFAPALWHVGRCYRRGEGVAQDKAEAVEWFRKAAGQGLDLAFWSLGECYANGEGVPQDNAEAMRWFLKAAEEGLDAAQLLVARRYAEGKDVEQNTGKAIEWLTKAAKNGNDQAQWYLGNCCYYGTGVAEDKEASVVWYGRASRALNEFGVWCYDQKRYDTLDISLVKLYAQTKEQRLNWLLRRAESGWSSDKFNIVLIYLHGDLGYKDVGSRDAYLKEYQEKYADLGVEKNEAEAVKWLQKANESRARVILATRCETGNGVPQDIKEAVRLYRDAESDGNDDARFHMARCRYLGIGMKQDYLRAFEIFNKIVTEDITINGKHYIPDAKYYLGLCYLNGHGVEKDEAEGKKWIIHAADQGCAEAVDWLRPLAEREDAHVKYILGKAHYTGEGAEQNDEEAVRWFRPAAEQGVPDAQFTLGVCYHDGRGVEKNLSDAAKWFRLAGEQDVPEAQYNMGCCYYHGEGLEQNFVEAVRWYRLAAENGYTLAQNELGRCCFEGTGVERNFEEAAKWFHKAAESGLTEAQNRLGICYYEGKGVEQNFEEAVKCFELAAKQNDSAAQYRLGKCYFKGEGVKQEFTKAAKYFRLAAEQGIPEAQYSLGLCYTEGKGVSKIPFVAEQWLRKAAENGNNDAAELLKKTKTT
ncbi:MAG: sel1 repeat family protein [Thermoguttaceae bacterium]|nr:sel1 repeat family protein [Thermoguttaceae bacterium]